MINQETHKERWGISLCQGKGCELSAEPALQALFARLQTHEVTKPFAVETGLDEPTLARVRAIRTERLQTGKNVLLMDFFCISRCTTVCTRSSLTN
ncbi:hypothetical protein ACVIHF_002031 [Bradyrhizobium sp. USDA 4506]